VINIAFSGLEAKIWHIRASYSYSDNDSLWGQGTRSLEFLKMLTNILEAARYRVSITKVRVGHPFKKLFTTSSGMEPVRLNYSTIIGRSLVKVSRYLVSIGGEKPRKLLNHLDTLFMKCRVEDLVEKLKIMSHNTLNIIIFDDISSSYMFENISILRNSSSLIIYLSHDFYLDSVPSLLRSTVKTYEGNLIENTDLVVVSGCRDKELYRKEYGLKEEKLVTYANVFPPIDPPYTLNKLEKTIIQDKYSQISIVLNAGFKLSEENLRQYVYEVNEAVKEMEGLRVVALGDRISKVAREIKWGNNKLDVSPHIPDRISFLNYLSRGHIGINYAYKPMGTNVKRFDFALAGLVILSRIMGARGELLPYEYTYLDYADLKVKLSKMLGYDLENLKKMGYKNRVEALNIASKSYRELKEKISQHLGRNFEDNKA
jgi:hypothetical protein